MYFRTLRSARAIAILVGAIIIPALSKPAIANELNSSIRLSVGNSAQQRNDVQIPNSAAGTRFSLANEVGTDAFTAARFELNWSINDRHGIRVMLAPLSYTEPVSFATPVNFEGESYAANQLTNATYKFNSWRVGYHYTLPSTNKATYRVGATLKIRDAQIRLEQGTTTASNSDLGFVPLLYLNARYTLSKRLSLTADLDALGGGPGRAIDAGLLFDYALTQRWNLGVDLRILEGGADIDELLNFARFDSAFIALSVRF